MSLLSAIILGIIQGLTEFIPVSSSGHLVLAQTFWNVQSEQSITFEVFIHLGTLLAVVIYFHRQLWELIRSLFCWGRNLQSESNRQNRTLILYLIYATLTTGLFYLIFEDRLKSAYQNPMLVALLIGITGLVIFISDYVKNTSIPASNLGFFKAVIIGLAQGCAILPGISRSGSTIATSLFMGMRRKDIAHFSFILSIPAILGANVSEFSKLKSLDATELHVYIAGFIAAFISGYIVIAFLIRLIQTGQLKYFAFYCWFISSLSVTLLVLL